MGRGGVVPDLRVQISEEGADAERLAALSGYLRAELLELDVENVASIAVGEPPPGARAAGVAVVGGLLVTIGQAADSLQSVIVVIGEWLRRGERTHRKVRLELDGDVLELSAASAADQERLIGLFASRHGAGPGG
jgi:hypothetical protein